MRAIAIDNVTFRYPGTSIPALEEVGLEVASGELMCLVGPSGCGKTTLLKIVSGLLQPERGAIRFDGRDVTSVPPERRRAVMVFQSHLLFPFMSVAENIAFALRMRGVPLAERRRRAGEMLGNLRLEGFEERRPSSLSAGQRQRVALGRALIAEPAVLLLDEPLSNLDRHLREEMRQGIIELQRETGVTTICVTHDQEEAVLLGDRITMISAGRVVQVGSAEDFYERPASVEVAGFFGNNNHLEGEFSGDTITCSLGTFRVQPRSSTGVSSTGTVCIHIRPEAIEMQAPCGNRTNCIPARITRKVYVGTHVRYAVDVDGRPWRVVRTPTAEQFSEGDEVSLYLPEDRIWLTPE